MNHIRSALLFLLVSLVITTTTFSQISTNKTIGSGGDYATLKAACDDIMAQGVSANVTFYILGDLTETANVALAYNPGSYTITFKPAPSTTATVTYTQATDNAGTSGAWVLGQLNTSGAPLVTTNNIIIDGSNTVGGTSRDLTFTSSSGTNAYPFRIRGECNNITVKNCNMTAGLSTIAYGVWINAANVTAVDYIPDNITIQNCQITATASSSGTGVHIANSGTLVTLPTGIAVKNNSLTVRHRGVFYQSTNGLEVSGNTIQVNQTSNGLISVAVQGNTGNSGTINVFGNAITQLATANTTAGAFGIRAIAASGGGTYNIYNNFITGFATASTGTAEVVGIRVGVTSYIYHNTIVVNNVLTTGAGTTPTAAIVNYAATCDIRNNILVTEEDDFASYCIYGSTVPSVSDYNLLFRSGTNFASIGYFGAATADLAAWQSATSLDGNSASAAVNFLSATDLHLTGASNGDWQNLVGTTGLGVGTDIDGDSRSGTYPYKGADEASNPLPVQLSGFAARATAVGAVLSWQTASEVDNAGFEVERRAIAGPSTSLGTSRLSTVDGQWTKIGFVAGAGTSTSPHEYSFSDNPPPGRYAYRLKQVDRNGNTSYHGEVEIEVGVAPRAISLGDNYPNPFNPSTTIEFSVESEGPATLIIYDMTGREVATLFDGIARAGFVNRLTFDARSLASGTYVYRLQTGGQVMTKRMMLVK